MLETRQQLVRSDMGHFNSNSRLGGQPVRVWTDTVKPTISDSAVAQVAQDSWNHAFKKMADAGVCSYPGGYNFSDFLYTDDHTLFYAQQLCSNARDAVTQRVLGYERDADKVVLAYTAFVGMCFTAIHGDLLFFVTDVCDTSLSCACEACTLSKLGGLTRTILQNTQQEYFTPLYCKRPLCPFVEAALNNDYRRAAEIAGTTVVRVLFQKMSLVQYVEIGNIFRMHAQTVDSFSTMVLLCAFMRASVLLDPEPLHGEEMMAVARSANDAAFLSNQLRLLHARALNSNVIDRTQFLHVFTPDKDSRKLFGGHSEPRKLVPPGEYSPTLERLEQFAKQAKRVVTLTLLRDAASRVIFPRWLCTLAEGVFGLGAYKDVYERQSSRAFAEYECIIGTSPRLTTQTTAVAAAAVPVLATNALSTSDVCGVCCDPITECAAFVPCMHAICATCAQTCFDTKKTCPYCRQPATGVQRVVQVRVMTAE